MSSTVHRFEDHDLIVLKISESLDDSSAWAAYEMLEREALRHARVDELLDMRHLDVANLSTQCVQGIASRERQSHAGRIRRRGVVASQPVVVGLVNMYHGISRSPTAEYQVFDDVGAALGWMGASGLADVIGSLCDAPESPPRREE